MKGSVDETQFGIRLSVSISLFVSGSGSCGGCAVLFVFYRAVDQKGLVVIVFFLFFR